MQKKKRHLVKTASCRIGKFLEAFIQRNWTFKHPSALLKVKKLVDKHGQPKIVIQKKNKLRNLKDFYSRIDNPNWKTPFSLCLSKSYSANIRKFEVPFWILFTWFYWLKPHIVVSKYFQIRNSYILSSRNDAFCGE